MPFFDQANPKRPHDASTPAPIPISESSVSPSSSWYSTTVPSTAPTTRPHTPAHSNPSPTESWDTSIHPSTISSYPSFPNGNWRTQLTHALQNPSAAASSIQDTLKWPNVRDKVTDAATCASYTFQDAVNRACQGHDVPAMHDKVVASVSMPSLGVPCMRRVGRSLDALSDAAQDAFAARQVSAAGIRDQDVGGDCFWFARYMAGKAGRALVKQGIAGEWQVMASRENVVWQAGLHDALVRLFVDEKDVFGVKQLYGMTAIWSGDVANEVWRLELDTGLLEVVAKERSDETEEKRICLQVDFAFPEASGCLRIRDVERDVIAGGDWLAVE